MVLRRDKANISFNIYYIVICWLYDCWLEINMFFSQVQSREIMKNRIVFSTKQFIVKEKDFTWLTCFSRLGPSCYSCYSSIILIFIISKIFETNPSSIYLSLSMRGNIWRWIANSVVATVGAVAVWHIFMSFWPSFWVFPPEDLLRWVAKKIVRLLVKDVQFGNHLLIGQGRSAQLRKFEIICPVEVLRLNFGTFILKKVILWFQGY